MSGTADYLHAVWCLEGSGVVPGYLVVMGRKKILNRSCMSKKSFTTPQVEVRLLCTHTHTNTKWQQLHMVRPRSGRAYPRTGSKF